jgi:2,4-dienoyl-CoA reductase-like NADH-dependent reductase (Old Yellow Enzyme family)/siroheme synthase (precorrin-2 oxidase/ferrochelatase)
MEKYSNVFKTLRIKSMQVKNRIAMMPMGTNMAEPDGSINERHIRYYEQRAKGGTGLVMVENVCVDFPLGMNGPTQLRFDHDQFVPGMSRLVSLFHRYGACAAVQINHSGAGAMPSRIGMQCASSSDVPHKTGAAVPRPLEKDELFVIAEKYGQSAKRAVAAGFDCVEVHCGHVYLINQFLSPHYNRRTDEYGGSPENRARFPRMVLEKVREAVGPDFPVSARLSADDLIEGGNNQEDALRLWEYLDDLVDIYDVSVCVGDTVFYMTSGMHHEDGWRAGLTKGVRDKFGKPVIIQGNIQKPVVAERLLADGTADFIGLGRALIADPQWVNKLQKGRPEEIRPCIYCNIGCVHPRNVGMKPIRCTVNPDIIEENAYQRHRVKRLTNVVVVGGGTAGLEAACTAAEVGCRAFVLEQADRTGGLARRVSRLPAKRRLADIANWLETRASRLGNVHVLTRQKASWEILDALKPHIVINATGSTPLLPKIPGLLERIDAKEGCIHSITGLLDRLEQFQDCAGREVAVVGGGAVGLDVVEFFALKGAKTTVIEMMPAIGRDLDITTKDYMNHVVGKHAVTVMTDTKLVEVQDRCFIVEERGVRRLVPFETGVVCLGMKSADEGIEKLEKYCAGNDVVFFNIGDSKRPRKLIDGTEEARDVLLTLSSMDLF